MASVQKVAIVTGASKGIGAGLVTAFLDRGYGVIANSRNITKDNPFPKSDHLALVEGDIADSSTSARIAETALSRFGRVDVLGARRGRDLQVLGDRGGGLAPPGPEEVTRAARRHHMRKLHGTVRSRDR